MSSLLSVIRAAEKDAALERIARRGSIKNYKRTPWLIQMARRLPWWTPILWRPGEK